MKINFFGGGESFFLGEGGGVYNVSVKKMLGQNCWWSTFQGCQNGTEYGCYGKARTPFGIFDISHGFRLQSPTIDNGHIVRWRNSN